MIKQKIQFKDLLNNKVKVTIKIVDGKLSIMGEYWDDNFGQIQDNIKPKNKAQQRFVDIWNEWHLNNLNPWTPEQMRALKWKGLDYKDACKYLKGKWLYKVEYNWEPYKYWYSWITATLPEGLELEIEELLLKLN